MADSPILQFSYLTPHDMEKLSKIMVVKPYALRCVINHYTLTKHQDDPMIHLCSIIEIPFDDLQKIPEDYHLRDTYDSLIKQYGQEVVDICIPRDGRVIKYKIANIITFAMDKVYKRDDLRIDFNKYNMPNVNGRLLRAESSVSDMIYEAAQESFDIVDQDLSSQHCYIQIEKRRNENV